MEEISDNVDVIQEYVREIFGTCKGIGIDTGPYYAETASTKGNQDWHYWIVRNKFCRSDEAFHSRSVANSIAKEMNIQKGYR